MYYKILDDLDKTDKIFEWHICRNLYKEKHGGRGKGKREGKMKKGTRVYINNRKILQKQRMLLETFKIVKS